MRCARVLVQVDRAGHASGLGRDEKDLLVVLGVLARVVAVDGVEHRGVVGGERDRVDRSEVGRRRLVQEVAVQVEALYAEVLAVGHAQQILRLVKRQRVRHEEVRGHLLVLARPLAQILTGLAELDDARVAVAVGHEELARAQHGNVRRLTEVSPIVAGLHSDAHFEQRLVFVARREFQDLLKLHTHTEKSTSKKCSKNEKS